MLQFPNLLEEDFQRLTQVLNQLRDWTGAAAVLLVEKAGYLIASVGDTAAYDPTQMAALAANSFASNEFIAGLVGDRTFSCMFQQGETMSVLWRQVDETCLLVVVFPASLPVGLVRHYANSLAPVLQDHLASARDRSPSGGVDLSTLNPRDVGDAFKRTET